MQDLTLSDGGFLPQNRGLNQGPWGPSCLLQADRAFWDQDQLNVYCTNLAQKTAWLGFLDSS